MIILVGPTSSVVQIGVEKWVGPIPAADNPFVPKPDGTPFMGNSAQGTYGMVFRGKSYALQAPQEYVFFLEVLNESGVYDYWDAGRSDGPWDVYMDYYYIVNSFPKKQYGIFEMRAGERDRDVYRTKTRRRD